MSTQEAIGQLKKKLKQDKEYREAWHANITMAFIDNYTRYKGKNTKMRLAHNDVVAIANNSAEYFLKQLCDELHAPKGR